MHNEMIYARKALRSGANGYIMKERPSEELVAAVRQVLGGAVYVSEEVKNNVLSAFVAHDEDQSRETVVERLSDRERQIFLLLGKGLTSRMIADKLGLSVKTVDTHRSRIKLKLGIDTTPQLMLAAAEWADHEGLSAPAND
jgi:DNA-binding NarL/FixJ family response regulator